MESWSCPLVTTKLQPPAFGQRTVRRERLERLLDQVLDHRLTLVCAGAGFGKTTLLSALPLRKQPVVWYSLSRADADPAVFLTYLFEGISSMLANKPAKSLFKNLPASARTPQDLEAQVAHLANALARLLEDDSIVVLDDYHLVEHSEALSLLVDYFIAIVPPRVHVVISSRTNISMASLPKLRASGQVLDVGQEELRFSRQEAAEVLARGHGLKLLPTLLGALMEKTEGWPIGLQLAGQMLRNRPTVDVAEFLASFASSQRPLFDYLAQEVFLQQPAEVQEFLLRSSVLTSVDAETCDIVLRRDDSSQIIEQLRQSNLFFSASDGSSLRYHQLVRDFLRERLAKDRKAYVAVHEAAAHHYQRKANVEMAIHHFIMAGMYSSAASLISSVAEAMLRVSRFDTMVFWIDQLPSELLDEFPELLVRRAEIDEIRGRYDSALRWHDWAARVYRDKGDLLGLSRVLRSKGYILNWRICEPEDANRLHSEALSYLSEEHKAERAAILSNLARDRLSAGEPASSFLLYSQAMQIYEDLGDKEGQLATLINPGAWLYFDRGDFARSVAMLHKAAALARELGCKHQLAECNNSLSSNLFLWGRVDEAHSYALQALELSRELASDFSEAFALMNLANASREAGSDSLDEALKWYKRALEIFETAGNRRFTVVTLNFMSAALRQKGDTLEAIRAGRRALAFAKATSAPWIIALAKNALAAALVDVDPTEARGLLGQAIETFRGYDDKYNLAFAFFCLALLARQTGGKEWEEHADTCLKLSKEGSYDYLFRRETARGMPLLLGALEAGIETDYVSELLSAMGQQPTDRLLSLLSHRDYSVRQRAVRVLGRLGGERARKALLKSANSPFEAIRQEASAALARFTLPEHPLLEIRCLGTFSVRVGELFISEDEWKRKKVKSLLKFIVASPSLCATKDEIIDVFWPDLDPEAAYNNFYRTLHHLRRILEPSFKPPNSNYVLFDGGILKLAEDAIARIDIEDFHHYLTEARTAELAGRLDSAYACWQAAVDLYRADFMADDPYEDWAQPKREHFRELHIATLVKLSDYWIKREDWDVAADYLRRILGVDPTREEIHLRLMFCLVHAGNRVEALQQYRRCEMILRDELDTEPMSETKAYYEQLLAGVVPATQSLG